VNACTGGPAGAYITNPNPTCVSTSTTLPSDFIDQSWLSGNGITIHYGSEQNEDFCLRQPSPPGDAFDRSFRPQAIVPARPAGWLDSSTVAKKSLRVAKGAQVRLQYGDRVLIVGPNTINTVTDLCPLCGGDLHIDNYIITRRRRPVGHEALAIMAPSKRFDSTIRPGSSAHFGFCQRLGSHNEHEHSSPHRDVRRRCYVNLY